MLEKKLALIAVNPVNLISLLEKELGGIANIDFPTLGGLVFWDTLAEVDGWNFQKNKFSKHCRILDPDDRGRNHTLCIGKWINYPYQECKR